MADNSNPPITPLPTAVILFATMSPDILTADAVICPLDFNIKLSLVDEMDVSLIEKPPISPPRADIIPDIDTADAVICPLVPLRFNVPTLEVRSSPIANPPI